MLLSLSVGGTAEVQSLHSFGGNCVPYLNDGRMLKESRVTHKSNIVYLQFKLLSTYIGFGGQDGGQDDVREPLRSRNRLNKKNVQGGMKGYSTETVGKCKNV